MDIIEKLHYLSLSDANHESCSACSYHILKHGKKARVIAEVLYTRYDSRSWDNQIEAYVPRVSKSPKLRRRP